jgi:hypothetical protein
VVKWGVAVNVGLATAAAAISAFSLGGLAVPFSLIPFLLAVPVAFVSWVGRVLINRDCLAIAGSISLCRISFCR